jgi:Thymidylate synthase complementing protein
MSAHDEQWRARVVADSLSPAGSRVTTIEARIHRFVLAELNTHRAFSRNSASSRAVPVARMIRSVETDPALPEEFGTARAGMQAGPPIENDMEALTAWLAARDAAVAAARTLAELGVHKQVTNRLLEPFQWHTVIVTATYWDGFWQQRCSDLAQPEIRVAAQAMRAAYDASTPAAVGEGEWHLPYLQADEAGLDVEVAKRVCAARCARVSYLTHDGVRSIDEDLTLYERLVTATPPHASPLEHVATPTRSDTDPVGNLRGWVQLRHLVLV